MALSKQKLFDYAQSNNYRFDNANAMIYGTIDGYHFTASQLPSSGNFVVCMSVQNAEGTMADALFANIRKELPHINKATVAQSNSVRFETAFGRTTAKRFEALSLALGALPAYLQAKGLHNCCYHCATTSEPTGAYTVNGVGLHLCDGCAVNFASSLEQHNATHKAKRENVPFGIVGGLVGSLIGVAAIVLIGQLGYVAAISGFLLSICTLKGYEKMAGKISKIGILISLGIMIAMTFFGNRLDWAVFIMRETGRGLFDSFAIAPQLAVESSYTTNLMMIGLFALIGSVGSIISAFKAQAYSPTLSKLQ